MSNKVVFFLMTLNMVMIGVGFPLIGSEPHLFRLVGGLLLFMSGILAVHIQHSSLK